MTPSESTRLRALYDCAILDTPPEPSFDRITHLTATVLRLPICALSLADAERHWFKSRHGAPASQIPRRLSFCDETIRGDGVFMVADARADPRFCRAPIVVEPPHVRFYAGAPPVLPDGARIGALCALDVRPRADFGDREASMLMGLARVVVEMLEARSRQIALARLTEEIAHLARHDPLTGLANRRLLREQMERTLAGVREDAQAAVLYLDLDRFKQVNDSLGHPLGDALLQQVAERLRRTVGASDTVARLGGDEFAIVLSGLEAPAQAADLADRIIAAVGAPYQVEGHEVTIGVSIGVALAGRPSVPPEQLFKDADSALYLAKSAGRGRRMFYDAALRPDARESGRPTGTPTAA
jgi:diguanylate cyclase (GGDEF)-like protein